MLVCMYESYLWCSLESGVAAGEGRGRRSREEIGGRCAGGEESISGSRGKHRAWLSPLRHFPSFPLNCFSAPLQLRGANLSRTNVRTTFGLTGSLVVSKAVRLFSKQYRSCVYFLAVYFFVSSWTFDCYFILRSFSTSCLLWIIIKNGISVIQTWFEL